MQNTDVREATHVKLPSGRIERIVSKWGIGLDGRLAKPSEGGFGVVTESGQQVDMWSARAYFEEGEETK
jgi:hypothetical protein